MPYATPRKDVTGRSFAEQKNEIYGRIQTLVRTMTGERINREEARQIFDLSLEEAILAATTDGVCRLNRGMGSLKVKTYDGGTRRLPTGETVAYPEKRKIQLSPGQTTQEVLDAAPNLGDMVIRRRLDYASRDRIGEVAPEDR